MARNENTHNEDRFRISRILWFLYCFFLIASVVIIGRIAYIQFIWEPDQNTVKFFQPNRYESKTQPERGGIMDMNGKLLAISTPRYDIHMDCTVLKEDFETKNSEKKGDSLENDWRKKAKALSRELPKVLAKDGKTADYYYDLIIRNRDSKDLQGRKHVLITKNIDHNTYTKLCELPLFNEGQFKSGMITTPFEVRQYPYGELAGRVIGDIRIREDNPAGNRFIGIEGQYDYILRGTEGKQWMKKTDKGNIVDPDSTVTEVKHGHNLRTTIDIDMQDIADRALRTHIGDDMAIEGGCCVVMDVKTGAIRAMVNLKRNSKGELGENYNMAIGRPGEPGSIFKAVTLSILLEDEKVGLSSMIPTNNGKMAEFSEIKPDKYITDWERKYKVREISVQDGFKISSNYVFRKLAQDHYKDNPKKFIDRLYEYKLNDAYKFDITETAANKSRIPDPGTSEWSRSTLPSIAIGYAVMETPLNIVTFYNAIANKGKMMKPYLIEAEEENGKVINEFGPQILNGSIFSKATADSLTKALVLVTQEGTGATRLKNAKCTVAGKTGTARAVLDEEERKGSGDPYQDPDGNRKYQATFVGFFPAEDPQYTAIVTVYTKPTKKSVYGGVIPAMTFREIVDNVWSLDSRWGETLAARADVPDMKPKHIATQSGSTIPVPDVKGMGLKDALFAIENNGYNCVYEGIGHVVSQTPAAGTSCRKGETIKLVLR